MDTLSSPEQFPHATYGKHDTSNPDQKRPEVRRTTHLEQSYLCYWATTKQSKTPGRPLEPDHEISIPHSCPRHNGGLLDPLRRFKGMFAWLFLHEIDLILDNESLDVAYAISELTPKIKESVQGYIGRRINRAFSGWVDSPLEFRTVLRRTQSIVVGSLALQVILGVEWHSQNMDIYVPYGSAKDIVLDYLQGSESYNIVVDWNSDPGARFRKPFVMSVTQLHRIVRTLQGYIMRSIRVFQSNAGSTRPVALSGATWSMNWIGADEIIVGYPELTLAREGVPNESYQEFTLEEEGEFGPWLNKYGDRGFTVVDATSRPNPDGARVCFATCAGRRYQEEGEDVMRLTTRTYEEDLSPENAWLTNHWRSLSDFNFECLKHHIYDWTEVEASDGFGGQIVEVTPRTWEDSFERYHGLHRPCGPLIECFLRAQTRGTSIRSVRVTGTRSTREFASPPRPS